MSFARLFSFCILISFAKCSPLVAFLVLKFALHYKLSPLESAVDTSVGANLKEDAKKNHCSIPFFYFFWRYHSVGYFNEQFLFECSINMKYHKQQQKNYFEPYHRINFGFLLQVPERKWRKTKETKDRTNILHRLLADRFSLEVQQELYHPFAFAMTKHSPKWSLGNLAVSFLRTEGHKQIVLMIKPPSFREYVLTWTCGLLTKCVNRG